MTEQQRRALAAKVEAARVTARQVAAGVLPSPVVSLCVAVENLADALAGILDDADRRGPDEIMEDAAREAEMTPDEILEREA